MNVGVSGTPITLSLRGDLDLYNRASPFTQYSEIYLDGNQQKYIAYPAYCKY